MIKGLLLIRMYSTLKNSAASLLIPRDLVALRITHFHVDINCIENSDKDLLGSF